MSPQLAQPKPNQRRRKQRTTLPSLCRFGSDCERLGAGVRWRFSGSAGLSPTLRSTATANDMDPAIGGMVTPWVHDPAEPATGRSFSFLAPCSKGRWPLPAK